ncbi:aldehyde dehydrogenase family protein [Thalassotalea sp. ND16A]|uniref:aldehyde dehydrogenase family protein n=1 Tax=Thalassotalea sp. ND16A TaxID=1535422 RepID=UPI00051A5982|nr:aldehyde dehydrogenase family protein [Thalassotalea sp. ND16A]KGJ98439.1 hypothetical protein ND16A_0748 [Thalassotalea sp. ND16A]
MLIEKFNTMAYGTAPESDKEARKWLTEHKAKFGLFINGKWEKNAKDDYFPTASPANKEVLAEITQASTENIDEAVACARKALAGWQALTGHERAKHLYALARLIQKHSRVISVLESMDNGKTIRESRDLDIPLAARHFYYHAGWAQISETELTGYEAYGVIGQIIPWNFPFLMLAWKLAPALAAGNTIVLKPAESTSLSALYFADLIQKAGIPKGVINIITGDGEVGEAIVNHPDINKIAFTGSTKVGQIIRRAVAGTAKGLTLELGGKSPFIVFEDADLDGAVEGLVDAIWLNQGQVCCAGSRLLMQESIAEKLIAKIKHRMSKLRAGDSLDKCIDVGAIIDESQRQQIDTLVQQGVAEGATIWQAECALPEKGVYYPPTLLTDVGMNNTCMVNEIFGPVLTAITFRTQEEAIELANNTRYGLACSVWSEDINRALELAPQVRAGVIWINGSNMFDASVGFGGYKESGFGREGGHEGMLAYVKPTFLTSLKDEKPIVNVTPKNYTTSASLSTINRTAKMFIGGKQARADGGDSYPVFDNKGNLEGEVGLGNRKDIRNAVEAADKAAGWSVANGHTRAQILYYIAENLSLREKEFVESIKRMTGAKQAQAEKEVSLSIQRLFSAAAWADKFEGSVHQPPVRGVVLAMKEAVGIIGITAAENSPWLSFISLLSSAIAMGNRVIIIPGSQAALMAIDFYQILEASDLPAGVVNIITGNRDELTMAMATHNNVDALWYFGSQQTSQAIEVEAADNMKRTWVSYGKAYDWSDNGQAEGRNILNKAVEIKNIWVPYGDQMGGTTKY